jgi:hypothetical protein
MRVVLEFLIIPKYDILSMHSWSVRARSIFGFDKQSKITLVYPLGFGFPFVVQLSQQFLSLCLASL